MTSAARPTWSAALGSGGGLRDGSSAAPTLQTCAKDQPGHLKLKLRQIGQDAPEELNSRDFCSKPSACTPLKISLNLISGDSDEELNDSDEKELQPTIFNEKTLEINETFNYENENENENYNSSETEDYDEEEELMRELEKIRKERESEKAAKDRKITQQQDPHAILAANPLLIPVTLNDNEISISSSFGAKRRWDDDVVFKNQAKGIDEKPQKRFVNDTTRSDFHRRFMDKIIK